MLIIFYNNFALNINSVFFSNSNKALHMPRYICLILQAHGIKTDRSVKSVFLAGSSLTCFFGKFTSLFFWGENTCSLGCGVTPPLRARSLISHHWSLALLSLLY